MSTEVTQDTARQANGAAEKQLVIQACGADRGKRLDAIIRDACEADPDCKGCFSREALKKIIKEGACTVNAKATDNPSLRIKNGDRVTVTLHLPSSALEPEEGDTTVIYSDDDFCVVDKPAGLTVHPCPSCPSGTLIQRLASRFPSLLAMEGERPGIVHRIDKDTSGLLLVALNERSRLALAADFAERRVAKEYLAIASGRVEAGACDEPIGRDPSCPVRMAVVPENNGGREAHTRFTPLWVSPGGEATLLRVRILTGRTHQIRVHLAHLGHPLLGDQVYARGPVAALAPRQMLHAWNVAFRHPSTGETVHFSTRPPADFTACVEHLARRCQCLVVTGNPGSGKSTLTGMLAERGIPTISADALVSGYYAPGGAITSWLEHRVDDILSPDGSVNKSRLMESFEQSPALRREVEKLAHMLVRGDIQDFFNDCCAKRLPRCAAEIPLYFECQWAASGFEPKPLSIGVRTGLSLREKRLEETRGWSAQKAAAIEGWQWPEEKKMAACDLTIDNDGDLNSLEERVDTQLLPALDSMLESACSADLELLRTIWKGPAGAPLDPCPV